MLFHIVRITDMTRDYYDDRFRRSGFSLRMCALSFAGIILLLLLSLLFGGCTSVRYVPVESVRTDTVYQSRVLRDSVRVHDSIYVKEWQKGDTVYVDRDRWHVKYVEKEVHDTVYQSRVDSIQVPYPVEKGLTWWQERKIEFGELALVVIAGLLCFLFFRYKFG